MGIEVVVGIVGLGITVAAMVFHAGITHGKFKQLQARVTWLETRYDTSLADLYQSLNELKVGVAEIKVQIHGLPCNGDDGSGKACKLLNRKT